MIVILLFLVLKGAIWFLACRGVLLRFHGDYTMVGRYRVLLGGLRLILCSCRLLELPPRSGLLWFSLLGLHVSRWIVLILLIILILLILLIILILLMLLLLFLLPSLKCIRQEWVYMSWDHIARPVFCRHKARFHPNWHPPGSISSLCRWKLG